MRSCGNECLTCNARRQEIVGEWITLGGLVLAIGTLAAWCLVLSP